MEAQRLRDQEEFRLQLLEAKKRKFEKEEEERKRKEEEERFGCLILTRIMFKFLMLQLNPYLVNGAVSALGGSTGPGL